MHDGTLCSLIVLTYSGRISHVKTWKFPSPSSILFWQNKHLWVCISRLPNVTHRVSDRGRQWAVTDMISNHTTCRLVIRLLGCIIIFGYAFNSVSVKWLAVKTASEMTYTVSSGALNSTPTPTLIHPVSYHSFHHSLQIIFFFSAILFWGGGLQCCRDIRLSVLNQQLYFIRPVVGR